jgi:hypothetical protein
VGVPGPSGTEWAFLLLAWAALFAIVGEFLRALTARFVPLWRNPGPIERALVDFYLGGAVLYLVAAVPGGAFVAPVVEGIPIAATAGLAVLGVRAISRTGGVGAIVSSLRPLARPSSLAVLLSAASLYAVELATAAPVATGNTYDSSLLTTYASLLLTNHALPLSFSPYAATGILYPQASTVWFASGQAIFGLPPARTPLLVTPLFLGLAPLAGFVFGQRMVGTDRAGLAVALVLAWVGTGTRGIVYGSNDFVLAFPLVLVLAGQSRIWFDARLPVFPDVAAFGVLCGYSAVINPVGAEWLLLALPMGALLVRPGLFGRARAWFGRWALSVAVALVAVVPTLYVLAVGRSSPGFVPGSTGAVAGSRTGITEAQFLGAIDPFLFGNGDTGLSTLPALRLELAVLIALGLAVVLVVRRDSAVGRYLEPLRPFVAAGVVSLVVILGVVWAASTGSGAALAVSHLTSASELSAWLFTLYGVLAAIPLALALERFVGWVRRAEQATPPRSEPDRRRRPRAALPAYRAVVPMVVALVIVVPGVVLTPTELPPTLTRIYDDFGNVSAADFDLLSFSEGFFAGNGSWGARVLVAPGSAGEFLPGYCSHIVLLYPMVPGWRTVNASYELLIRDLPNATLGPVDRAALTTLNVSYVVVTGNNTRLFWAFSPTPFLEHPANFVEVFHEADAYLFAYLTPFPEAAPAGGTAGTGAVGAPR